MCPLILGLQALRLPIVYGTQEIRLHDFQSFVYSSSFHIVAIVETWLSSFIFDNEILPTGYTLYRKDRASRGGGVLLAIHNSIPSLQLKSPLDLEIITVQLRARGNLVICLVYMRPNSDFSYCSKLFDYLSSISDTHQTLILGDLNSPDICWSTLSGQSSTSRVLCDLVFHHNLSQLVDFPTHTSGNILDLIGLVITDLKQGGGV